MTTDQLTAPAGDKQSRREVLDFLVTEEQLGVTFVTAAIENAAGTPSEAFVPVLRNAVTQEYHHVEALKDAGGKRAHDHVLVPRRGVRRRQRRRCSGRSRWSRRSRSASTCSA